ncbi:MAG TPA: HAD-IA family hydrolase [Devosiaceae bacterium]
MPVIATPAADWPGAVLFDLDGTLIDSVGDIAAALNELVGRRGLGPLPVDVVKTMIGNGIAKLVERAYLAFEQPLHGEELAREIEDMRAIYDTHISGFTTLLPGALETLRHLNAINIPCAVVTNKPIRSAREVLDHFGVSGLLSAIVGDDGRIKPKPAPDMLFRALDEIGVRREKAVMVGDSVADFEAGRAAGLPVIVVDGGYGVVPEGGIAADVTIPAMTELVAALDSLRQKLSRTA